MSETGLRLCGLILAARVLSLEEFGIYSYCMAVSSFLTMPTLFGLPPIIVREGAKYSSSGQWSLFKGVLVRSNQITVTASLLAIPMILGVGYIISEGALTEEGFLTLLLALAMLPVRAAGRVRIAALRSIGKATWAQLPELLFRPAAFLLFVAVLWFLPLKSVGSSHVMGLQFIAVCLTFVMGLALFRYFVRGHLRAYEAIFETRYWLAAAGPIFVTTCTVYLTKNVDMLLLGPLSGAESAGLYRPAQQIGMLMTFGIMSVNMVVQPMLARCHAAGDLEAVQRVSEKMAGSAFVFALPFLFAYVFMGETVLSIFGDEYVKGHMALVILGVGHLLAVSFGPVDSILNMTGNQRAAMKGSVVSAIVAIPLCVILIIKWDEVGAALAMALTQILWASTLYVLVRKDVGINSQALAMVLRFARKP